MSKRPEIIEATVNKQDVYLKLDTGVTIRLSVNPDYVNLNFAGIGNNQIKPFERAANVINIQYKDTENGSSH